MLETLISMDGMQPLLTTWGINLIFAITIFVVGRWLARFIVLISKRLMQRAGADEILANFVLSILNGLLLMMIVIAALSKLGVNTASLVALIGAAGLAIGLSLQDSLKNFAAGVMLIAFRPFKAGDFVEAGGTLGVVEKINIFSSTLRTPDNREVIVPNGNIYSSVITNFSARETRRIDLVFGIGYGDDIRKAKSVIGEILEADSRVLKDPAAVIAVGELGTNSVDLIVRPWVKAGDYFTTMCDLKEVIKLAFDDHGISIPYPQLDLHLDPAAVGAVKSSASPD